MKLKLFTVALIAAFTASHVQAIKLDQDPPKEEKELQLKNEGGTQCVSFGDKKFPAGCCEDDKPLAARVQESIDRNEKRCTACKLWPTGGKADPPAAAAQADAEPASEGEGEGDAEQCCGCPAMVAPVIVQHVA